MATSSCTFSSAPLSSSLNQFLAQRFGTKEDLPKSSYIEHELSVGCADLEATLSDLDRRLSETISVYSSRSDEVEERLRGIKQGLVVLKSSITNPVHGNVDNTKNFSQLRIGKIEIMNFKFLVILCDIQMRICQIRYPILFVCYSKVVKHTKYASKDLHDVSLIHFHFGFYIILNKFISIWNLNRGE